MLKVPKSLKNLSYNINNIGRFYLGWVCYKSPYTPINGNKLFYL